MFARRVVSWQLSTSLHTDLALDALKMGIWTRRRAGRDLSQLIHHSDRGGHYRAIRDTDRLADAEAVASVGSKGDSYNALAEAFNSLFKAELIRNKGPWRGINDLEIATAEYIDWFNHRRLHGEIGYRPPIEVENEFLNNTTPAITPMETGLTDPPPNPGLDSSRSTADVWSGSFRPVRPASCGGASVDGGRSRGVRARSLHR
ncbi:transposase InsO family protein [Glaciihabitans sp. UYNi722]